jgi:hypothetical protein
MDDGQEDDWLDYLADAVKKNPAAMRDFSLVNDSRKFFICLIWFRVK